MQRRSLYEARGKKNEVYVSYKTAQHKGHLLANPFRAKAHDKTGHDQATRKYRHWLWKMIKERKQPILKALAALPPDAVLLCQCRANLACHADVIMAAWHYCYEQGLIPPPVSQWEPHRTAARSDKPAFLVTYKTSVDTHAVPISPRRITFFAA